MCHHAPWLSALDKQNATQFDFAPKESKADVVSEFWRYSIPYSGSSSREVILFLRLEIVQMILPNSASEWRTVVISVDQGCSP